MGSGVENINGEVAELVAAGPLERVLAQIDVMYFGGGDLVPDELRCGDGRPRDVDSNGTGRSPARLAPGLETTRPHD
jgi:hypothetical protein